MYILYLYNMYSSNNNNDDNIHHTKNTYVP